LVKFIDLYTKKKPWVSDIIMKHKFKFKEIIEGKKVYIVECKETKGKFCTSLWDKLKLERDKCHCCLCKVKE